MHARTSREGRPDHPIMFYILLLFAETMSNPDLLSALSDPDAISE